MTYNSSINNQLSQITSPCTLNLGTVNLVSQGKRSTKLSAQSYDQLAHDVVHRNGIKLYKITDFHSSFVTSKW